MQIFANEAIKKVDGPQETVLSESVNGFMFDTGLNGSTDNWGKKLNSKYSQIALYHSHNAIHIYNRPS